MLEASLSLDDRSRLIVYVDNSEDDLPYIARIANGEVVDSVAFEETSSADPAILEQMLSYTRTHYPAKSYGLVLWGHSSGWLVSEREIPYNRTRSYGIDYGVGSTGESRCWMNIPPMARAIANGMGGERLKFIAADCCNFGCIEVAYELRNVTDYLLSSPAEIPDPGAPYELVTANLFSTSEDFYKDYVDTYYLFYMEATTESPNFFYNSSPGDLKGYSLPMSAVKTSELEELAQATARLLATIPDKLQPSATLRLDSVTAYGYYEGELMAYDMAQMLCQNTSASAYNAWRSVFNKAVPYALYSGHWLTYSSVLMKRMANNPDESDTFGGVSMFFPMSDYTSTDPCWNTTIQEYQWNNVIKWEQYGW